METLKVKRQCEHNESKACCATCKWNAIQSEPKKSPCCNAEMRYLDCEMCKDQNKVCELIVCCECGETCND